MSDHQDHHDGHQVNYKKIYFILLGLLVVSVAGPFLEILWVTLLTAFGIAIVKARLVINNFMHLKWEKRLVKWVLTTSLLLMGLMFAGVAPDVMNHEGNNWENLAAQAAVARGVAGEHEEEEAEDVVEVVVGFSAQSTFTVVCGACHGAAGDGTGAAAAALNPRPASFIDPVFWETRDRDRILTVIRDGAAAVGGSPLMVPWRASYDDEQIQALTDYVMSLRPNE
ncbi:MAG: c-type cytochrome [Gemmatimonadetes bacterium]|nr:c-type cytochrome [Gemmatimonadota bacterium]MDA1102188.1 c-type cytochrome [Gemmatimonadota bacterium]